MYQGSTALQWQYQPRADNMTKMHAPSSTVSFKECSCPAAPNQDLPPSPKEES